MQLEELGDIGGKKSRPFNFDHIQILGASWLLNANLVQTEATLPSMDIRITSLAGVIDGHLSAHQSRRPRPRRDSLWGCQGGDKVREAWCRDCRTL
jgi:hypothetical protein